MNCNNCRVLPRYGMSAGGCTRIPVIFLACTFCITAQKTDSVYIFIYISGKYTWYAFEIDGN